MAITKAVIDTLIAEAGGEGDAGLIAAAWAIQQRAAARGQTIDQVVRSGFDGFTNPGAGARKSQQDPALRAKVEQIMRGVQSGDIPNPVPGADHFLSGDVMPSWAKQMKLVATVGGHRFYASGKVPASAQGRAVSADDLPAVASELSVNRAVTGMPTQRTPNPANPPLPQPRPERTADVPLPRLDPRQPNRMDLAAGPAPVVERRLPPIFMPGGSLAGQERGPTTAPRKAVVTPTPSQAEAATGFRLPGQSSAMTRQEQRADNGQGRPATAPRVALFSELPGPSSAPKTQDRLDTGQAAIVPRFGTTQPTRQQVEQGTGFRLPPAQVTPPGMPTPASQRPSSPLVKEVEVENPAYAALARRVAQGEIEMRGISPSGMAMSRDARARFDASKKALEEAQTRLAQMQRTVTVQQTQRQAPAPLKIVVQADRPAGGGGQSFVGSSTGKTYVAGQRYQMGNDTYKATPGGGFVNERTGREVAKGNDWQSRHGLN